LLPHGRAPTAASASAARTTVERRYRRCHEPDDDGRITHAIRYDESMKHVLEELEGEAAEAAYGRRASDEIDSPPCMSDPVNGQKCDRVERS
jgi:hypothetical protein